ncbi:hypothetical protein OIDMADRAFT_136384 [Oidiodendron maius Zn]|uniref:VOC domain-containing protein n=1 Tax=Oidiodendron maius (strain Zn) TaxID=913774 RepID=A0A0C3CWR8_OIDMZ|nr:hypothetical protein OIDMADRAFT_136384 [Oidiodendron maius Zn]
MSSVTQTQPQRPKVLSPKKLAHVVLRTNNFSAMVQFYKDFLGARSEYENDRAAFLAYDEEHHRIGIFAFEHVEVPKIPSPGLEHIAFTFDNLDDLVTAYEQRKEYNIRPFWSVNHGATTSMYYRDPDGNRLESQVDNFENNEEATAYVRSETYDKNPIGADFDPEELVRRVRSGEDHKAIKRMPDVGPRGFPTLPPTTG